MGSGLEGMACCPIGDRDRFVGRSVASPRGWLLPAGEGLASQAQAQRFVLQCISTLFALFMVNSFVFCDALLLGLLFSPGCPLMVPLGFRVFTKRCVSLV